MVWSKCIERKLILIEIGGKGEFQLGLSLGSGLELTASTYDRG